MFYVYCHCRPDGTPFYVGKGRGRRSHVFSARNVWHRNIVKKYGRDNIIVEVQECSSEDEAFFRERTIIASLRAAGVKLVNLTDGGDGTSGWNHSLETINKISASNRGANNASTGKARHTTKHTDETRAILSCRTVKQFESDAARLKQSLRSQELWGDPTHVANQAMGRAKRDYKKECGEQASKLSTLKIKCAECGMVTNYGNMAKHQRAAKHIGCVPVDVSEPSPDKEKKLLRKERI